MNGEKVLHTVIIEVGSSTIKGGFGGESSPRFVFPLEQSHINAKKNLSSKGHIFRSYLLVLFTKIFHEILQIKPSTSRVVIVENVFELKACRDLTLSILIQDLQVNQGHELRQYLICSLMCVCVRFNLFPCSQTSFCRFW